MRSLTTRTILPATGLLLALLAPPAAAATRLARVFDHHMVLQRGEKVAVFGTDDPGREVRVAFAGQVKSTTAGDSGSWRVDLDPLTASTSGRNLVAKGSSTATLNDVLVGEVWLAAGQSNMNWQVRQSSGKPDPARFPLVRMANWEGSVGASGGQTYGPEDFAKLTPANHYTGTWQLIDETSVASQSAVAWFFADALARESKGRVPIGIVDVSRGGTTTEAFISPAVLRQNPYLSAAFDDPRRARTLGQWATSRINKNLGDYNHPDPALPHPHPFAPGFLHWTAMPHIVPFTFKGVIWYQGESNAEFTTNSFRWNGERLADHQHMVMVTLIDSWRDEFGKPELPFYMVQLPRIKAANRVLWPWYREAQQRVADDRDGVELAVAIEFGIDGGNVHPPDKQPVGERLARIALAKAYGRDSGYSGPAFTGHRRAGSRVVLRFDHLGGGLVDKDGGTLRNFEIAGADRNFVPAAARIAGDTVEVAATAVPEPVAVRYAWHMNVDVDLFNKAGLPAAPFRTDDWRVAPGRPIRVACIGDSITFGSQLENPAEDAYPARLATLLGDGFEVKSFGKPGFGIHRPAKKYDRTAEYQAALAFEPDIVICNLGINDITHWGSYDRDGLVAEFRKLVDAFASLPTAPWFLQWHELAPLFPGQKFHGDPDVDTLNDWLGRAAAHTGVDTIDMFQALEEHPDWFPDNIHPNEEGSQAIAGEIHRRIEAVDAEH